MRIADMKIGLRLNISFALTIGLLAVVVAVGASRLSLVGAEIGLTVGPRYAQIAALGKVKDGLDLQVRALRNALLLADPAAVNTELDRAQGLNAELARSAPALGETRQAYTSARDRLAALLRADDREGATALLFASLQPAQQQYFAAIDSELAAQVKLMRASGEQAQATAGLASKAMVALGAIGAVLSMLTAWYITRGIVMPLRRAASAARSVASGDLGGRVQVRSLDETGQLSQALKDMQDSLVRIVGKVRAGTDTITRASAEIAAGNQHLSQRTEDQASALETTAASMAALTQTVRQNAEHAQQANALAQSASDVAGKGGAVVSQVVSTMDAINASSRKITEIINVIDGIAFQTNILALNAAVEAARAGEQGRGFAVVAGEVRNLAQRSAAAASEISKLIKDSVGQVDQGAALVGTAGRTMDDIVASVGRVTAIMADISSASHAQLSGIEQVNQAIVQMDDSTEQNAALVEEAAAAAAAMREQALQLSEAVGIFRLDPAQRQARVIPLARAGRAAPPRPQQSQQSPARPRRVSASGKRSAGADDWESL